MTRKETGIIMDILTAAYPRFYSGYDPADFRNAINLWSDMFRNDDVALVAAAVKSVIESDEKGFPPSIGQVKSKMRLLVQKPNELTEAEAWSLVAKAVKNGLYESEKEFAKLPQNIQKLVGSHNQLRDWAMLDSDTLHSVVSSNFQRSYRAIAAREQEIAKLPADVKKIIAQIGGDVQTAEPARLPAYEAYEDSVKRLEQDRRKFWEEARERQDQKKRTVQEVIAKLKGDGNGDK